MFKNLLEKAAKALHSLIGAFKAHPVEMGIALYSFLALVVMRAGDYDAANIPPSWYLRPVVVAPIFFAVAYCLNTRIEQRGIKIAYLLSWLPMLGFVFDSGIFDWTEQISYNITVMVMLPLLVICQRLIADNTRFAAEAYRLITAAATALILSVVAYCLTLPTIESVHYIFFADQGVWHSYYPYAIFFLLTIAAPMIFFAVADNAEKDMSISRFGIMLLDWIITPALLIYTAILYVYAAKILLTWTLPDGNVAMMIFVFTITAMAAKALQQFMTRQRYGWFFDHFSLIALPLTILFWTGTMRRVSEYGVTELRFYLILCGAIMTLYILLFLGKKSGRYLAVCLTAFALFGITTYIKPLTARQVSLHSQIHRARVAAAELGILDSEGSLRLGTASDTDTAQRTLHRTIYKSLEYIGSTDSATLKAEFGIAEAQEYLGSLTSSTADYASAYSTPSETAEQERSYYIAYNRHNNNPVSIDLTGYDHATVNAIDYRRTSDSGNIISEEITVEGITLSADAILDTQLAKLGFTRQQPPSEKWLNDHAEEFMIFRSDSLLIVFNNMRLSFDEQGNMFIDYAQDNFSAVK